MPYTFKANFFLPNLLAIIVAALVPLIMGFIWYHPKLFGTVWQREAGVSDDKMKNANMILIFGVSLICSFLLAMYVNSIANHDTYVRGATWYIEKKGTPEEIAEAKAWQDAYTRMVVNKPAYTTSRWTHGFAHAFVVMGLFFIIPLFVTNGLFERKSWKYIFINAGYWVITIGLMGIIIASWT